MSSFEQTKESLETARAALEAETREVVQVSQRLNENLVEAVKRIWRQLVLIWVVVISLVISYLLVFSRMPLATNRVSQENQVHQDVRGETETAGLPQASQPLAHDIPEGTGLLKLLNKVRDAQYKKDINMFLAAYATSFPDLAQKRELTLKIWQRYDYLDLQFQITDAQQRDAATISGKVVWNIKTRDRKDDGVKTFSKAYQVEFSKESGEWLIRNLDLIAGPATPTQQ